MQTTDVFVSYSGDQGQKIAEAFQQGLPKYAVQKGMQESDLNVFVASQSLTPGDDWEQKIWDNLREAPWFIFVVTKESNASHYAQQELGAAMALGKNIIPVLCAGMTSRDLPGFCARKHAVSTSDSQEKVAKAIKRIIDDKWLVVLSDRDAEAKAGMQRYVDMLAGKEPPITSVVAKITRILDEGGHAPMKRR